MGQWAKFSGPRGERMAALLESPAFGMPEKGAKVLEVLPLSDAPPDYSQHPLFKAGFEAAVAAARQAPAAEGIAPGDWETEYAKFRAGPAFPADAPALKVAFAAGIAWERRRNQTEEES